MVHTMFADDHIYGLVLNSPLEGTREHSINYIALSPVSPVLILTASSTGVTKIFPSPILPVFALCLIASTTLLTSS